MRKSSLGYTLVLASALLALSAPAVSSSLMTLSTSVSRSAQQTQGLLGWERRVVSNGSVHIEVFHRGEGRPVVMHPSLGRAGRDFENLGNRVVAAGYKVVLVNPRGIEGSKGDMDGVTLETLASDVWNVAEAFGFERIFMLGQNFGNRVSRTVSYQNPDRVLGLMLLAAGGEIEPDAATWKEFQNVFDPGLSAERHQRAVANSFFAVGNDASVWAGGWFSTTAQQQVAAAKATDFAPMYNGGTAPALVIQGLEDKIAPPQNGWSFVTRRANARLVALPGMGHAMLPEQPGPIADAVISFLNDQAH